ncbi:hypothetical protein BC833DRAFT_592887 [Globomyces pollinis-pini]|nr:hypothetical protein BC833DRAFT_592887 [Globomyces pollinis-pini]
MEHYSKTKTLQLEIPELKDLSPHIQIGNGKVRSYVQAADVALKSNTIIFISATGLAINKAVSVTEIIKRNHKQLTAHIEIFEAPCVDVWESKNGDLDPLEVTAHLPGIKVTLVSES